MGISVGNIVTQGIIGAVQGGAQAAYVTALDQQKQESERIREERLFQLRAQEHATNKTSDLAAEKAAADLKAKENADFYDRTAKTAPGKGIIEQAQADYQTDDGAQTSTSNPVTTTVPPSRADVAAFRLEEAKKTGKPDLIKQSYDEDKDVRANSDADRKNRIEERRIEQERGKQPLYDAQTRLAIANAEDIEANGRHREALPERPSVVERKDEAGRVIGYYDRFSGAEKQIIKGSPEVPAKSHVFGADEPGKPAVPDREVWTINGKMLPNGLSDLYPAMGKKVADATSPKTAKAAPDSGPELLNTVGADGGTVEGKSKVPPPASLPMPTGKGAAKFTGKYSPAGHPLYQGADGKLFEGR